MKTMTHDDGKSSSFFATPAFSRFAAWALSFGCAVGWGAFAMPGNMFLPDAGPLGSVSGMCIGALAMVVIAWNCHCIVRDNPGPGGAYSFVKRTFGSDHGFLNAWFLLLTYFAILWANATALVFVIRCVFGDNLHIGPHYGIADFDIYLTETAICILAIVVAARFCLARRKTTAGVLKICATAVVAGAALSFAAILLNHRGGLASMAPLFSAEAGHTPLFGTMRIVALAPWAFVGFEVITHSSGEFSFDRRRSFSVMVWAIAAATLVYSLLAVIPALCFPEGFSNWPDYIAAHHIADGVPQLHLFVSIRTALGKPGVAVIVAAMLGAIFTTLVGNTLTLSRLLFAMQRDGILPKWFGRVNRNGEPANAILFVTCVSMIVAFLGRTIIGTIVDVASIGAAIAYGYMSAAASHSERRLTRVGGFVGIGLSIAFLLLLLVPNFLSGAMLASDSYLVLAIWCSLGFLFFRHVFKHDRRNGFGQSTIVWISMLVLIFFTTVMWLHETSTTHNTGAFANVVEFARHTAAESDAATVVERLETEAVPSELSSVNRSLVRHGLVLTSLVAMAMGVLLNLYSILRRREHKLERDKLEAQRYFFSTVSHDIRTPLNAIVGFSEMMKSGFRSDNEREQAADSILASGKTLLRLVDDVIDLSKLESGVIETKPEPTDVARLARELLDSFRITVRDKKLDIRAVIGDVPTLLLDPQRLRQILFHLVGNAVKFTKEGFVELRIAYERGEAGDEAGGGTLGIEVEDTGPGIGEEDIRKILSPYVQLDSAVSRHSGTGLGLAITRNVATAMNGALTVASTPGKGSTFSIRLRGVTETPKPAAAPSSPDTAAPKGAPRILIVDDVKMNLLVLKALLGKLGVKELSMAMNGREALDALRTGTGVDMVLTDIWMPELDGVGLLKEIRADAALSSLPVFAITADVEMQKKPEGAEFTGLFLKPITLENLETILGRRTESRATTARTR